METHGMIAQIKVSECPLVSEFCTKFKKQDWLICSFKSEFKQVVWLYRISFEMG